MIKRLKAFLPTLSRNYVGETNALLAAKDVEIQRLREMLTRWVPEPQELSGWDDEDAPADAQDAIREACEVWGVPVPEHCREENTNG